MSLGDVQRLRAFALALDLGSVSAAAEVLGYTQSAVSQQLAALEREVGMRLVDRSKRPLRPTRDGAILRPHLDRVLTAAADAEAAMEDVRGGVLRLRLVAFPSALSSFVPAAVRDLRRAHPELSVQAQQLEASDAMDRLRAGDADVAVVHHMPGSAVVETGDLKRRQLLVDELYVLVPSGHPLARREAVSVGDLQGEALVLPRRDTPAARFRAVIEQLCAEAGFAPTVSYELDDLAAAQAFVAAGIAIVPMHGLILAAVPPGADVRPLSERPAGSRRVEALVPAAARSPIADELLERLAASARAYRPQRRAVR